MAMERLHLAAGGAFGYYGEKSRRRINARVSGSEVRMTGSRWPLSVALMLAACLLSNPTKTQTTTGAVQGQSGIAAPAITGDKTEAARLYAPGRDYVDRHGGVR